MTGHNSQRPPSVNNLISFWSDIETPANAPEAFSPTRLRGSQGSQPILHRAPTGNALLSSSSPFARPSAVRPSRGSAPLLPLRSVAPTQSRVFGTQRHALDTLNIRPISSSAARPFENIRPGAAHHTRQHPLSTKAYEVAQHVSSQPSLTSPTRSTQYQHPQSGLLSSPSPLSDTPPSAMRLSEGILKLTVVPPVQVKEETVKHHNHPARSHTLVSTTEPLERPLNALLNVVKPTFEPKPSSAMLNLDKLSAACKAGSNSQDIKRIDRHIPRQDSGKSSDDLEKQGTTREKQRLTSETTSESLSSGLPPSQRRTRVSVDNEEQYTDLQEDGRTRGSGIMYAVVKGVPAKPAIPKLVGATGSGTVVIPNSRRESWEESTGSASGINDEPHGEGFTPNRASWSTESKVARFDSQQTLTNSSAVSMDNPTPSDKGILEEFMPDDSPGALADRDTMEKTKLLRGTGESDLAATNASGRARAGQRKTNTTAAITVKKVSTKLQVERRYTEGTPIGTRKSEGAPKHSIVESPDALFQPTAPLVSFPTLDVYLSSLKPYTFSEIQSSPPTPQFTGGGMSSAATPAVKPKKEPAPVPREGMFPPLDKIPVGVTLDELKINVTKPPGFFDQELQNVILSSAVDGIMSGEASNVGISWMRLEIIRDFLQFVALYLSVSGNTFVNQKWLYATVNIIPALLSLDFPSAIGYGMVFLILFSLVCFAALYTFKIMTRTDPNDDIEGLEVSSWSLRSKKQRVETISIVFLLTTLYLPLAKLSFDALVWSDTMWPITNPYTNTDFPTLEPLGPSGIYRDPSDFCYVTSMKIQDLNFAYAIIPLAIFTLCANTFYFPLAIRRLVVLNLPRIDQYTEQGEIRLDLDEEYKRLTNSDNCPYNFLYNGYRREFGTYKVVVMFNKLLAVIIVVLFSKDNCLFRGYERRTIEATRAGLQIVFTASLIYRHYRTQPFLYASQNLSEYWSRACTVATSVIGLFIVLNVGPLSVNALGIMLVATYVLMCVIVIWFVIRQTQKFQVMLKQLQQRLDFSLDIYSPKLNYFKHIKRRIWQETWTTTLLVEDSYKMPPGKVVAYSQSPHRPPYLLNFMGTVAERHVENLRIVRQIGLRSYKQACQFLTPAMVRKRGLILREFVGPDMYYAPEFMASNIKTYFGKAYVVPFPFSVVFVYDESSVVVTLVKDQDLDRYIHQNQDPEIRRRRELRYQLRALDGKFVVRPFIETKGIQRGREYNGTMEMSFVNAPVSYKRGLFTIHRKKMSNWQGHNMNPGFSVTITYSDGEVQDPEGSSQLLHETTIGHEIIGITRDFQVTPALARLLRDNHALVSRGVKKVKKVMQAYQAHYRNEAHRKDATLSYDFFVNVYDNPTLKYKELEPLLMATEENPKVRHPSPQVSLAITFLFERMAAVNRSRCHQWWYLFWDDLYRKNHEEIPQLVPKEFSPAFPGSICYRPLSRPDLEKFLERQGCWQKNGRAGFMHVGVLNQMYAFLNELVFERMTKEDRKKQLELTAVERQRLESIFLVTKAHINSNGTYTRMPLKSGNEKDDIGISSHDQESTPSNISTIQQTRKKGWFESITPGRLRKQTSHPHADNYSIGYIIPQTWHQKASQFTALLIGGRQEDMIGESDEEDHFEDSEDIPQKRRRTSASSLETLLTTEGNTGSNDINRQATHQSAQSKKERSKKTTEAQDQWIYQSLHLTQRSPMQVRDRESHRESWTSMSTLSDERAMEGAQSEELVPLNLRTSSQNERVIAECGNDGIKLVDDDARSITSMSSEDYW
ncbi:hypothetical protein EDD21DRAFT_36136 [Dissophora ornata]|nr:hypothetical protein BGZ58_010150 [Dissophora ornata]KAI8603354.1 hypothetical protein EDD21DRAFT_36136 [Dissophora ornata]